MKYLLLIFLSTQAYAQNLSNVDPAFISIVKEFIESASNHQIDVNSRIDNLAIKFGYPERIVEGECAAYSFYEKKQIVVSIKFWSNPNISNDVKKMALIHELGHTVLLRKHTKGMLTDNKKKQTFPSIMNESILMSLTEKLSKDRMDLLLNELFTKIEFDHLAFDPLNIAENTYQSMGMDKFIYKK
jgi:hypothetical protein